MEELNPTNEATEPRNPWLLRSLGGAAGLVLAAGVAYGGRYLYLESTSPTPPFHPDRCGEGRPTPGKGGISAVNHALENMEPPVAASNQTITKLGREANDLYGGNIDVGDSVQVCVDLDSGVAKVTKPSTTDH